MRLRLDLVIDVENFPVFPDVIGPSEGNFSLSVDDAVSGGGFLLWVAKNRVVEIQRFSKFLVGLGIITTCREVRHLKFADDIAAPTERLAFSSSATRERFRKPRQNHYLLSLEV